ncbi:hypothetical protein A8709_13500 [Paenibacillus pectinilyticus]|uniref:Xylose isomerase n=1 Tax=Paenibacillus pectinilyticus TaxID=512399 RepID=A0A1C1A3R4_9BACL|nr:sugar phosphate isomerase/epimerase [Paenibacillus pectinilyticus]OCT15120.1 hypothetical protein A8709_13500 [Paenibacillus pectinilyticus]
MNVLGFRSFWDLLPIEWQMNKETEAIIEKIAEAGFDGIEFIPPHNPKDDTVFVKRLQRLGLKFIGQVGTQEADHAGSFREKTARLRDLNPVLIVSHSAKDSMSFDQQCVFFEEALAIEQALQIPVAHETHRGRAMFVPWATAALLRKFPELRINADFSHWMVACEGMPLEPNEDMNLAISRAIHIHGRIGYSEGPQVPDPRDPYYEPYVKQHLHWWTLIAQERREAGHPQITFTPEFGPPPYLHTLPYTNMPVADTWEINTWMLNRFKANIR